MLNKNNIMRIVCVFLIISIVVPSTHVFASSYDRNKNQELDPIQSTRIFLDDYELSDEQVQLFQKITLVSDYYFFDKNNKIQISLSGDQLMTEFGFSKQEVRFLHRNVLNKQVYSSNHDLADNNPITPLVHISGGALYISYNDLVAGVAAGLVVAASAGPAAIELPHKICTHS